VSIFGSPRRGPRLRSRSGAESELIEGLRDEMVNRATRHEILAAQRTDLIVDQLWRRLESANARLATAVQQLEERVSLLEHELALAGAPEADDTSILLDE
jgi:hypothetical protein